MAENLENEHLMNDDEFRKKLELWSHKIHRGAIQVITSETESYSGGLRGITEDTVVRNEGDNVRSYARVRFRLPRHGVYVHYGVGRGWIRQSGTVVRGWKHSVKKITPSPKGRQAVDFLDRQIKANYKEFIDLALEWTEDRGLAAIRKVLRKMTFSKKLK